MDRGKILSSMRIARHKVQDMFPDVVVTGVRKAHWNWCPTSQNTIRVAWNPALSGSAMRQKLVKLLQFLSLNRGNCFSGFPVSRPVEEADAAFCNLIFEEEIQRMKYSLGFLNLSLNEMIPFDGEPVALGTPTSEGEEGKNFGEFSYPSKPVLLGSRSLGICPQFQMIRKKLFFGFTKSTKSWKQRIPPRPPSRP